MRYRLLITLIVCATTLLSRAQDPLFTQFYHSPLYLNPAFVGCAKNEFRLSYTGRMQWMSLPQPFQYHTLSADKYDADHDISGGLTVDHFEEGYIHTTALSGILAKNFGCNGYSQRPLFVNFAMKFGYAFKTADRNKYLFADQLTQNGPNGQQSQVELSQNARRNYFDISAGVVLTFGNVMIGAAGHHLSHPPDGLIGSSIDSKLPRRYTLHLSYILEGYSNNANAIAIKPTIIFNKQDASKALFFGSLFDLPEQHIEFGIWYRNNWTFQDNHSFAISVNIKFGREKNYYNGEGNDRYRAGLSYDGEINRPGIRHTAGSTEMGILYESPSEVCPKPSGGGCGRFPWEFH